MRGGARGRATGLNGLQGCPPEPNGPILVPDGVREARPYPLSATPDSRDLSPSLSTPGRLSRPDRPLCQHTTAGLQSFKGAPQLPRCESLRGAGNTSLRLPILRASERGAPGPGSAAPSPPLGLEDPGSVPGRGNGWSGACGCGPGRALVGGHHALCPPAPRFWRLPRALALATAVVGRRDQVQAACRLLEDGTSPIRT